MTTISTTPPILQGPTAKEKKYDRQLRLWAAAGQQALEESHVLLLNDGAGVVGVETLKNLVLPGFGNFTIVDGKVVGEEDLGVNFFLSEESLGKSRAEETCRFLRELNPEVKGQGIATSVDNWLDSTSSITQYTLVLAIYPSQWTSAWQNLAQSAFTAGIPIFYITSTGFYSLFTVQLPAQFPIVDTHPDPSSTQDLRLLDPWLELADFTSVKTADIDKISDHEHGHIPYLLLLLHYLEKWKREHDGKAPSTYKEKTEFRSTVEAGTRRDNPEGGEENFAEAVGAVLKSLNPPSISSGLKEIFAAEEMKVLNQDIPNFWLIAHAIHQFHTNHGVLPLPGSLPDMKAQSADYIQLQNIYHRKARRDLAEVTSYIRNQESTIDRLATPIPDREIEAFCKGAAFVRLIRGHCMDFSSPLNENSPSTPLHGIERKMLQDLADEDSLAHVALAMLVYQQRAHWLEPGVDLLARETGIVDPATRGATKLDVYVSELLTSLFARAAGGTSNSSGGDFNAVSAATRVKSAVKELLRAGNGELHNISALTGGMVAQEVIKVVTKQYVPVETACVFDGIQSKSQIFEF